MCSLAKVQATGKAVGKKETAWTVKVKDGGASVEPFKIKKPRERRGKVGGPFRRERNNNKGGRKREEEGPTRPERKEEAGGIGVKRN